MNEQQQIGALEAMLFAHADPVEAARLADALRVEPEEAVRLLKKLQKKLAVTPYSFPLLPFHFLQTETLPLISLMLQFHFHFETNLFHKAFLTLYM